MPPKPSAGPLARLHATVARHPHLARAALWSGVAATLAGGLLAVGAEAMLGEAALARAGAGVCLAGGALYAALRLLGVRAAGPHEDRGARQRR